MEWKQSNDETHAIEITHHFPCSRIRGEVSFQGLWSDREEGVAHLHGRQAVLRGSSSDIDERGYRARTYT